MDNKLKVQKAAPISGYFALNHPASGKVFLVDRAEATRAMAQRFQQYREQLNSRDAMPKKKR